MFDIFIDADGLPSAVTYYRAFPSEPSPEGTVDFDARLIHAVHQISLLTLLPALANARNSDIMIVCHAFVPTGDGLFMPLAPGSRLHASVDALNLLMVMQDVEDTAAPVRRMPEKTADQRQEKISKWKDVFDFIRRKDLGPVDVDPDLTLDKAAKQFSNVRAETARRISLPVQTMLQLIEARRLCVNKHIGRLEFRACDLGSHTANLQVMKKYFGATKATAPKFETFFHPGARLATLQVTQDPLRPGFPLFPALKGLFRFAQPLTDAQHRAAAHQPVDFHPDDILAETPLTHLDTHHPGRRASPMDIATNGAHQLFTAGVLLFVWKFDEAHFRFEDLIVTIRKFAPGPPSTEPDWSAVNAFVTANISTLGWRIHDGPPLAGLWNPTDGNQPFLLPLGTDYTKAIISV